MKNNVEPYMSIQPHDLPQIAPAPYLPPLFYFSPSNPASQIPKLLSSFSFYGEKPVPIMYRDAPKVGYI